MYVDYARRATAVRRDLATVARSRPELETAVVGTTQTVAVHKVGRDVTLSRRAPCKTVKGPTCAVA